MRQDLSLNWVFRNLISLGSTHIATPASWKTKDCKPAEQPLFFDWTLSPNPHTSRLMFLVITISPYVLLLARPLHNPKPKSLLSAYEQHWATVPNSRDMKTGGDPQDKGFRPRGLFLVWDWGKLKRWLKRFFLGGFNRLLSSFVCLYYWNHTGSTHIQDSKLAVCARA